MKIYFFIIKLLNRKFQMKPPHTIQMPYTYILVHPCRVYTVQNPFAEGRVLNTKGCFQVSFV